MYKHLEESIDELTKVLLEADVEQETEFAFFPSGKKHGRNE